MPLLAHGRRTSMHPRGTGGGIPGRRNTYADTTKKLLILCLNLEPGLLYIASRLGRSPLHSTYYTLHTSSIGLMIYGACCC